MGTRLPALRRPPIAFAHRGARADAPENTIEAFSLALRMGASGLESDVWLTADGAAVLHHDKRVRPGGRAVVNLPRARLPTVVPTLEELYEECGADFELSLDVKDPDALRRVVEIARAAGAAHRLWLCHPDSDRVRSWRPVVGEARLVDSTRLRRIREGPERRAAALADAGVDAVNLRENDWTGGLAALFHRFGLQAFGWDAQHDRQLDALLDMGLDGLYSDHVDRMTDAVARYYPTTD